MDIFFGSYRHHLSCDEEHIIWTHLRDILDVLYDGRYHGVDNEELYVTIMKKIKRLEYSPYREKRYKLLKIMSILKSSLKIVKNNCISNKEVVLLLLNNIYLLCENILNNDEQY